MADLYAYDAAARITKVEMSPGILFILGSKGKRSRSLTSRNKSVPVFRQTATLPLAAYLSHAGFSLLQCPAAHAMLATPGFPYVTSPRPLLLYNEMLTACDRQTASFSCVEFFAVTGQTKGQTDGCHIDVINVCNVYEKFLLNAFVIFVNVYCCDKHHMKCRIKTMSNS